MTGRVVTGLPVVMSGMTGRLVSVLPVFISGMTRSGKIPMANAGINSGCAALEADTLTIRPTRRSITCRAVILVPLW